MKQKTLFKLVVSGSGLFVAALVSVGRLSESNPPCDAVEFPLPCVTFPRRCSNRC